MNEYALFAAALLVPILLAGFFLSLKPARLRKLGKKDRDRLLSEMGKLENSSPVERIVWYDKVLDHFLAAAGHTWTLGEKLKKKPRVLGRRLEDAWRLHKVRNRVVHELDVVGRADSHAEEYRELLLSLLEGK